MLMTNIEQAILPIPIRYSVGYLSATENRPQPLCGNSEGWGPVSPHRFDFTPCFLDVWIAAVAVFGISFGAGALWYLLYQCTPQPISKNWHFFAKLVCIPLLKTMSTLD